jgi:mono/diheme cytochrome c family protein
MAIYGGWDSGATSVRHQTFTTNPAPLDNPLGSTGLKLLDYVVASAPGQTIEKTLPLTNTYGGHYTVFVAALGGVPGQYVLTVTTVPEPVDTDGDGVTDENDNCPSVSNADQADADSDTIGDVCDPFPNEPNNDLAQCLSDLAEVTADHDACHEELEMTSGELDTTKAALVTANADSDADGRRDQEDACPETAAGADVDQGGCSVEQFCTAIDATTKTGQKVCKKADWRNDEPIMKKARPTARWRRAARAATTIAVCPRRSLRVAAIAALLVTSSSAAAATQTPAGVWQGQIALADQEPASAAASLTVKGRRVVGTIELVLPAGIDTISVHGRRHGSRVRLHGRDAGTRFRWRGHWSDFSSSWSGSVLLAGDGGKRRGTLTLADPGDIFSSSCGAFAEFTNDVVPVVIEPICSQCHVEGGLAGAARFRVTPDDPAATMLSALRLIDADRPLRSLLLRKPRAQVAHAGGTQLVPGTPADDTLLAWIEQVISPPCGGGVHVGPLTPAELFADSCASCHGTDARGSGGRPDIHCNRSIHDVVRTGRTGATEDMPAFPDAELSDDDIVAIQGHLLTLCPTATVTGADLLAGNCASCHQPATIRCATRVADAVRVGRATAMPAFPASTMPDAELQRLIDTLSGLCADAGRTAADLFAGNCQSCHGADGPVATTRSVSPGSTCDART